MLKITILAWVITIIAYAIFRIQCKWLSTEERKLYEERGIFPMRLLVLAAFMCTSFIASITLTIITVAIR
jgi:hypothetical protein